MLLDNSLCYIKLGRNGQMWIASLTVCCFVDSVGIAQQQDPLLEQQKAALTKMQVLHQEPLHQLRVSAHHLSNGLYYELVLNHPS